LKTMSYLSNGSTDPGNLRIFTRVGENGLAGNRPWSRRQQAHEARVVQGQDLSVVQISSRAMSHTQSPRSAALAARKTPGIEIRGSRPGKKSCPGPLIGCQAVSRKVPAPRGLEQVGRKPLNVTPLEPAFLISHKHGGILRSRSYFAITALIVRNGVDYREGCDIIGSIILRSGSYLFRRPSSHLIVRRQSRASH
jgi:hypothetical protein